MKAIFHNNGLVQSIVYATHILSDEELQRAVIVDEIPNPVKQNFIMWVNPETKAIIYEYLDTELEVAVKELKVSNANMEYVLMMEGIL